MLNFVVTLLLYIDISVKMKTKAESVALWRRIIPMMPMAIFSSSGASSIRIIAISMKNISIGTASAKLTVTVFTLKLHTVNFSTSAPPCSMSCATAM